jgi:hypothetical protein
MVWYKYGMGNRSKTGGRSTDEGIGKLSPSVIMREGPPNEVMAFYFIRDEEDERKQHENERSNSLKKRQLTIPKPQFTSRT